VHDLNPSIWLANKSLKSGDYGTLARAIKWPSRKENDKEKR